MCHSFSVASSKGGEKMVKNKSYFFFFSLKKLKVFGRKGGAKVFIKHSSSQLFNDF